jgi:hypothetical protein
MTKNLMAEKSLTSFMPNSVLGMAFDIEVFEVYNKEFKLVLAELIATEPQSRFVLVYLRVTEPQF